jgi:hypothetical protein
VLLLNTCTHQQVRAGYWYVALIPEAAERLVQRYASIETLSVERIVRGVATVARHG